MDGVAGERFVVEDDGYPNLLLSALRAAMRDNPGGQSCPIADGVPGAAAACGRLRQRRDGVVGRRRRCRRWRAAAGPQVAAAVQSHVRSRMETRGVARRNRGHRRDAPPHERSHRWPSRLRSGLAAVQEPADAAPARGMPHGRGARRPASSIIAARSSATTICSWWTTRLCLSRSAATRRTRLPRSLSTSRLTWRERHPRCPPAARRV